jgi:glycosyltransferase involved in cell wall biosynthesis
VDVKDDLKFFDLIHYPYFDPFFLTLPINKNKNTVVTVHDLIPIKFPEYFPKGIKGNIKWQWQKNRLRNMSGILTDSISSKNDIVDLIGIKKEKINVVYLGVDKTFRKIEDKKTIETVKSKFKITERFILYVGDVNENKNIIGLISSFELLLKDIPDIKLILCGNGFGETSGQLNFIRQLITKKKIKESVNIIGTVNIYDLVALYNIASVYVQPSWAEGFGLPVLEAMSCGCPVVSSDKTSLPEICGNAAVLADVKDYNNIKYAIKKILIEDTFRLKLIKKGYENVKKFTWEKTAEETVKIYKKYTG